MIKVNKNLDLIEEYKPSDRGANITSKLDWNECNLPIDESFYKLLIESLQKINLSEYPNINNTTLINKLAKYCDLSNDEIQIFNGSDSALNYIFSAFLNNDSKVLIFYPNYNQIETYIKIHSNNITYSHIDDIFNTHIYDFSKVYECDVVYLSNPNNPTGYYLETGIIEDLLATHPDKLFIIDEAYYDFFGSTAVQLVKKYKNIIVTRTFSKAFSLASIRLGYICCSHELLSKINKIRNSKEVNAFAQILGELALDNFNYINDRINLIKNNLSFFKAGLNELGINYVDSKANFILMQITNVKILISALKKEGILVRDRSMFIGLNDCVRISIGTKEEMDLILKVIKSHKEV